MCNIMVNNKDVQCLLGQSHTGILVLWGNRFGIYLFSCLNQPAIKMCIFERQLHCLDSSGFGKIMEKVYLFQLLDVWKLKLRI